MFDPEEDGWVAILVIDNGTGIPPDKLADIFRPFVSTKGSKGTGLGLAVSRKILREHGGDIRCESQPGKTKFLLRLPVYSALGIDPSLTAADHRTLVPPED
jgi:signal transduction histidine kinase